MADVHDSIDANAKLKELRSFAQHYMSVVNNPEQGPHVPVTVAEMAVICETMADLFQGVGLGVRRNQVGQAMPKRRGWERHG